jgi:hypothetical protein
VFIQVFLSKNKYFYLQNAFFYEYVDDKYLIIREDDIIHNLLSTISKNKELLQWKSKTKINVIKQIKDTSLFTSIPETNTIQNVLNVIYPAFFISKNAAKYFLTIIGDNILKKNTNLIFLVTPKMKQLLNELDNVAIISIGANNTTNNFITKYHENHTYDNCRLVKINENFTSDIWRVLLKTFGLDLLCVSVYYSKHYENSDKFIENALDGELQIYSHYLKNKNAMNIVNDFCNKYVTDSVPEYTIEWKNLHFVWKQFLSDSNLPSVIYSNTLKNIFKEKYYYDEKNDSFVGITSKYLPMHRDFIKFWENNIIETANDELEIDEICSLFKHWSKTNNLNEEHVLKILTHFFNSVVIVEEKYVLNVSCSLWNKADSIHNSFEYIKKQINVNANLPELVSFDDLYTYYCKYCHTNTIKNIVSKKYFYAYLCSHLSAHIVYDKFIKSEWIYF